MGPLSAVAISIWLVIYGLVYSLVLAATVSSSAAKAVAVIGWIAAALVIIDVFWARSHRWLPARGNPQQGG